LCLRVGSIRKHVRVKKTLEIKGMVRISAAQQKSLTEEAGKLVRESFVHNGLR
jgi:hypothetical protein